MRANLLFPYQAAGAEQLAKSDRLYLGDMPGLGKSRTALSAAHRAGVKALHVLCPAVVRAHWRREHAVMGYGYDLHVESYQRYVVSEAARRPFLFGRRSTVALVLDEAHFLKHAASRRTQLILETGTGLAHGYGRVWPLSGTPLPRNAAEMFPILLALWPEKLQARGVETYPAFLDRYCQWRPTKYGPRVFGLKNADELHALVSSVMLRRRVRDVLPDLPPLRWGVVTIEAVPGDAMNTVYELENGVRTRAAILEGELPPVDESLARYRHAVGDAKAPAAAELVQDELDADEAVKRVVFAYHRSVLDYLENALRRYGVSRVDGSVTGAKREAELHNFARGPNRVFLGQLQACATGLDGLQYGAHDAVLVEPDWATDVNVQAGRRVSRIGSTLPGLARMLALAGTLDEAIIRNHHREVHIVEQALGETT